MLNLPLLQRASEVLRASSFEEGGALHLPVRRVGDQLALCQKPRPVQLVRQLQGRKRYFTTCKTCMPVSWNDDTSSLSGSSCHFLGVMHSAYLTVPARAKT
jgi:hypothetical protein